MGSIIEIMGTTVTNINPDKGEDWLVVKRKNRKPSNNKVINVIDLDHKKRKARNAHKLGMGPIVSI